ncbi:PHM/PNGase F domain-containing protein [Chytridium lagenaria]|nr:PHM/PNGase F domain-containing protein [Chytridium lagenaria]
MGILSLLLVAVAAVSAFAAPACYQSFDKSAFPSCTVLGSRIACIGRYITFGVDADVASSSGNWIGVGISDMGGMKGSDIWLLIQNADKSYTLQDSYSSDFAQPVADTSQDLILITPPAASDTNTVYTFPAIGSSPRLSQHSPTNRGDAKAILFPDPSAPPPPQDPSDLRTFEIRMPNVTIPARSTSYICSHFSMPADTKYHVIRVEGLPASKYIHHMIVYGCTAPPVAPARDGDMYDCAKMDSSCGEFTFSWVPGSSGYIYPAEAGVPIGTGPNANRHFSLQVHYDNPNQDFNVIDNSGMKVWYTENLRPNDVGVLTVGTTSISIPGNSVEPTVLKPNECPSACTSKFPGSITVLSSGVHMHNLGFNQTTQRIRNGKELSPLSVRRFYDFNYQGQVPIIDPDSRTLLPGDSLITTSAYIPTQGLRNTTTRFGESTNDEMAFNFIQYYPKFPAVEYCMTIDRIGRAICTTKARLAQVGLSGGGGGGASQSDMVAILTNLTKSGELVESSKTLAYEPFKPVCVPKKENGVTVTTTRTSGSTGGRSLGVGMGVAVFSLAIAIVL